MEEIVSEFIVGSCQFLPKSCAFASFAKQIPVPGPCHDPMSHSIFCGSGEEFYIHPLNKCINDLDQLEFDSHKLVFIDESPQLINDLHVSDLSDTIECYKIVPYHQYPSFVRLRLLGNMNYNWKRKIYEFSATTFPNRYIKYRTDDLSNCVDCFDANGIITITKTVKGPAIGYRVNKEGVSVDCVHSIWCPQWPFEAQSWTKRRRTNRWPTQATISEIVQHGCHVVYVQHRACRNDEMQWRLSFSVAEVILLHSWTKVQQIVYHLLRFFSERELMEKNCPKENEVLCMYHLKTMMLWTCEETSSEWWNSSSVFAICYELLKRLLECIKRRYCPNYFIPEANLFHNSYDSTLLEKIEGRLHDFHNSGILCNWFLERYIKPASFEFQNKIKVEDPFDFGDYMLRLIDFRKANTSKSLDYLFYRGYIYCHHKTSGLIKLRYKVGLSQCLQNACFVRKFDSLLHRPLSILPTTENDRCFISCDATLYCLHIVNALESGSISWDSELFLDFVKTGIFLKPKIIKCQFHEFPLPTSTYESQLQLLRAQDLMENLNGSNNPPEFQLLSLLSKTFLRKALRCDDSQSHNIAPTALAYLAAIHFATSECQTVIDLCSSVLVNHTTSTETLNAGCLFFIDDVVRLVGCWLLCKKFNENNIYYFRQHVYLDLRLTPKVFAKHLAIISTESSSKKLDLSQYFTNSALPFDQLLLVLTKREFLKAVRSKNCFKSSIRRCDYQRTCSLTADATSAVRNKVTDILMEYAIENITVFYSLIHKDFGIQCNTVECYRALYLYKNRQYDEVLHLCKGILRAPDLANDMQEFAFANVLLLPPLNLLFDRDIQALLGFHTLFYYLSPLNDESKKFDLAFKSTFEHWFSKFVYHGKHALPYSLESIDCTYSRYQYFIGRHFLAAYLTLRCGLDLSPPHSCKKAMAYLIALKCILPFEHIIRRFFIQKLLSLRTVISQ